MKFINRCSRYNIYIIIIVFLAGCNSVKPNHAASSQKKEIESIEFSKNDTFDFINKTIIENKERYLGKSLNTVLQDIPYSFVSYMISPTHIRKLTAGITLSFKSRDTTGRLIMQKKFPILLSVVWAVPIPADSAYYFSGKSLGAWLTPDKNYFGNKVVKDIVLTHWNLSSN